MSEVAEKVTLTKAAEEAMAEAEGRTEQAARILADRVTADPELAQKAIFKGAKEAVETILRNDRARTVRRAPYDPNNKGDNDGVDPRAQAIGHANLWMDFPLAGGLRLRDAGHEHLAKAIDHYRQQERASRQRAAWLEQVRDRLPDYALVGQALEPSDLQRCWEETE